jgi:hypothetical protein
MMTPPIIRADMPHEVVWHSSCCPASLRYRIEKAWAKLVPR